jgi:protein-S-isoprenylcysteine O-methyltransferase Ste14
MTVLDRAGLLWPVLGVNVGFIALLVARVMASRAAATRGRTDTASRASQEAPVATRRIESRQATAVLVAMSATSAVYYVGLVLWLIAPRWLGAPLAAPSAPLQIAGLACALAGLGLMGWAYVVFRSWRWRAEVDPGHQLMTGGPFGLIRHPIYLSFAVFYLGSVLLLPYAVFLLHALASLVAYDYRARAEEAVMLDAFGDRYREYRDRTRRFLPGVY